MTIFIIIAVIAVIFIAIYNSLVRKRNETENAFGAIDVMLKKRYDLIPNLVATVKQYAEHEKSTFAQITEMRNKSYASFSSQEKKIWTLLSHRPAHTSLPLQKTIRN